MRRVVILLVLSCASVSEAATLAVEVRNAEGAGVSDAVVYAIPEGAAPVPPARVAVMDQRDRQFIPYVLPIQTGTAVSFPNSDDVRHHVYSFSPAKKFQLPLYEGTPAEPVRFDRAGVVAIGCNIHDRMRAYVVVVDTPYFALTRDGRAALELPAGRYRVRMWSPAHEREPEPQEIAIRAGEERRLRFVAARD